VKATIENVVHVEPRVFWEHLFFDPEFNQGLYRELGFQSYEVLSLTRMPDGRMQRSLRAEPPLRGPELLQRHLRGRIYYTEEGTYDPLRGVWEFVNHSSVAAGTTKVSGAIRAEAHPAGMRHVVELALSVSALGLGSLVERTIEKNTRESYRVATQYTNEYARARGLAHASEGSR
jgi:hypothetical protein